MANSIGWCDLTINPIVGCSKVSIGCENCYALKMAWRLAHNPDPAISAKYQGVVEKVDGVLRWTGKINYDLSVLNKIATGKMKGRKKVFIGSMTDCFHENVDSDKLHTILRAVNRSPHTCIMLTKRPHNMLSAMSTYYNNYACKHGIHPDDSIIKNLWLGVTVCNQQEADEKIPILLKTPAAKRFVSIEPMLDNIHLARLQNKGDFIMPLHGKRIEMADCGIGCPVHKTNKLDWVICGGETGQKARPIHPSWVISLRDQCIAAEVPFFFKSWGRHLPVNHGEGLIDGVECHQFPEA